MSRATKMKRLFFKCALCLAFFAASLKPHASAADQAPEPIAVASSSIRTVAYDAKRHLLEIEFRRGAKYRYHEVPAPIFQALLQAESKGRYFAENIRGKFAFEHLEKTP